MPPDPKRPDVPDVTVSCNVCMKKVPSSEARVFEAEDYVLYFCGIECFDHWRRKAEGKDMTRNPGR